MSAPAIVRTHAEFEATPELLASIFWGAWSSKEQAQFFDALAVEVKKTFDEPDNKWRHICGEEGEGQWWHLAKDLAELPKARSMLMAIAAPHYWHTLKAAA